MNKPCSEKRQREKADTEVDQWGQYNSRDAQVAARFVPMDPK